MGFGTANAADQFPTIPLKHKASIKCIYSILKSNGAVRSVDTYALDGFRSAIEFTFTDVKGEQSTTDILLSGVLNAHFADRGRAFRAMVGADFT